jgi:hypothetical protein
MKINSLALILLAEYRDRSPQTLQERRKRLQPQLAICGRRKATSFLAIPDPRNLVLKTQGRTLRMGHLRPSLRVARNDPELAQLREVEVAKPAPKEEVGERQPSRAGMFPLHFDDILSEPRTLFNRNSSYHIISKFCVVVEFVYLTLAYLLLFHRGYSTVLYYVASCIACRSVGHIIFPWVRVPLFCVITVGCAQSAIIKVVDYRTFILVPLHRQDSPVP